MMSEYIRSLVNLLVRELAVRRLSRFRLYHTESVGVGFSVSGKYIMYGPTESRPVQIPGWIGQKCFLLFRKKIDSTDGLIRVERSILHKLAELSQDSGYSDAGEKPLVVIR